MAYAAVSFAAGEVLPAAKLAQLAENTAVHEAAIARLDVERPIAYIGVNTGSAVVAGTSIASIVVPAVGYQTRVLVQVTCQAGGVAGGGVVSYAMTNSAAYPQGIPTLPGVTFQANGYATVNLQAWVTVPAAGTTTITLTTGSSVNAIYTGTVVASRAIF